MAHWTVDRYVSRIRDQADAVGHPRWDDTNFVIPKLAMVHTLSWRNILNANKFYRTATRSASTDSNGRISYDSLETGANETLERTYKVLGITEAGIPLRRARQRDVPVDPLTDQGSTRSRYEWYPSGRIIQLDPANAGIALKIRINHLPARADALGNTNKELIFVNDFEDALVYLAAGFLFMKGGAQTRETREMFAIAQPLLADLMADVRRESGEPLEIEYADDASDWGAGG